MTLSRFTKWLGGIVTIGYLLTLATSHYALSTLKVGGPVFSKIAVGKDLIADILPPPAYLLEAYLEATLALNAQAQAGASSEVARNAGAHVEKLKALQKDYEDRQTFW